MERGQCRPYVKLIVWNPHTQREGVRDMLDTNAVAVVMVEAAKLIDKLELEHSIPLGDRTFLAAYQAKLAAGPTRKDEDELFLKIFREWAIFRHKQ